MTTLVPPDALPLPARGRSRIAGDTFATIAAQIVGLAVTLALTPIQLERMGYQRYGLVTLAISVVGLFNFLDYGLSWAALRYIPSMRTARNMTAAADLASLLVTAALGLGLGVAVAATVITAGTAVFAESALKLDALRLELVGICALLLPALMTSNVLSSVARALGQFRLAAAVSVTYFVTTNVVWAAVAGRAHDILLVLAWQTVFMVASAGFWFWRLRADGLDQLRISPRVAKRGFTPRRPVLVFAGMSALTGASSTLFATADKVAIAVGVGVGQLPLYTIVAGLCGRIAIVSSAFTAVIFPRLAAAHSSENARAYALLSYWGSRATVLATGALGSALFWAGHDFLSVWISPSFAARSSTILRLLVIGFGMEAVGQLGYAANDSRGGVRRSMVSGLGCAFAGLLGTGAAAAAFGLNAGASAFAAALTIHGAIGLVLGFGKPSVTSLRRAVADVAPAFVFVGLVEWAMQAGGAGSLVTLLAAGASALVIAAAQGRWLLRRRVSDKVNGFLEESG